MALAENFHPLDAAFVVPGADGLTVVTYVVLPASAEPTTVGGDPCRGPADS